MPVQDQAVWRQVNVVTGGTPVVYQRGELLPPPASDAENNTRTLLRLGGALRVVEVVFTPDELKARGEVAGAGPARAGATAGMPATVAPGPDSDPRLPVAPVVLGPKPSAQATKTAWVEYAVTQGAERTDAEKLSRDQLAQRYRDAD